MSIPFKNPVPHHTFNPSLEKSRVTRLFTKREVPKSSTNHLLLATWNIANLGAQHRSPEAFDVVAHILKRFDLIAVQEVNDDFNGLVNVVSRLPGFDYVMTDPAGNQERLAFVYRKSRVKPTNLFGEIALRPAQYPKRTVTVRYRKGGQDLEQRFKDFRFEPFDRNPAVGSFKSGPLSLTLANCHLYFGAFGDSIDEKSRKKYARRTLEIVALAKWANGRFNKTTNYDADIVLLGDMNVPAMDPKEPTYRELIRYGWQPVDYPSQVGGANLGNDKTYDQMAFAPETLQPRIVSRGVFDFDNAVFPDLWERLSAPNSGLSHTKATSMFRRHVKHHLSDHRPLWVQLRTD